MALRSRSNVDGKVDTENGIFVEMEGVMEVRYMSGDDEITDRMDFFEFQAATKRIPADFCHKDMSTGEQALFFCLVCDCELKSIIPLKSHVEASIFLLFLFSITRWMKARRENMLLLA